VNDVDVLQINQRHVFNKFQLGLTAVRSWCQRWNIEINGGKTWGDLL
jgi:hypothetical protein